MLLSYINVLDFSMHRKYDGTGGYTRREHGKWSKWSIRKSYSLLRSMAGTMENGIGSLGVVKPTRQPKLPIVVVRNGSRRLLKKSFFSQGPSTL